MWIQYILKVSLMASCCLNRSAAWPWTLRALLSEIFQLHSILKVKVLLKSEENMYPV